MSKNTNTQKTASVKTKAKIISFNIKDQTGEALSEKGEKITFTPSSFEATEDSQKFKPEVSIECLVFNQREKGFLAYSAKIL